MWRNISTRLFRQYVQAGIQTSGAGCQDEECKRTLPSGFYLPEYTLKESNSTNQSSIRLYSSFEDGDDWEEKNDQHQHFRCGSFWGSCWNHGNIAEAVGLGSAIVLGLQLGRAVNNQEKQDEKVENGHLYQLANGHLYQLAYAMPFSKHIRKSILPATKDTLQEKDKPDKSEEDALEAVEREALESIGEAYNTLALEFSRAGQYIDAASYFRAGAKAGSQQAQYNLAVCYEHGRGLDTNDKKAAYWYKKAALQGHAMAQYNYAIFHLLGLGIKRNEKEAVHWLNKSANQGLCQAQSYLGSRLIYGPNQDLSKGIDLLKKAVKQKDAEATYRLAMCYEDGIGVAINQAKAVDLYNKAAMNGHSEAQCCMGRFHQLGLGGIPANRTEAKAWFSKASENGNQEAKESLASLRFLESDESFKNVSNLASISLPHCSHSSPNLVSDFGLIDHIGSGDSKPSIWANWPSISYLDLLPSFQKHSQTNSKHLGRSSFQLGDDDNIHTFKENR
ncbi:uncharacterized protein [Antedon mediterranea]|uniref:uncharacterized protein n=1 Tax=Antedon mediterranea TaxID=105859 RepID=UPI003AF6875B